MRFSCASGFTKTTTKELNKADISKLPALYNGIGRNLIIVKTAFLGENTPFITPNLTSRTSCKCWGSVPKCAIRTPILHDVCSQASSAKAEWSRCVDASPLSKLGENWRCLLAQIIRGSILCLFRGRHSTETYL